MGSGLELSVISVLTSCGAEDIVHRAVLERGVVCGVRHPAGWEGAAGLAKSCEREYMMTTDVTSKKIRLSVSNAVHSLAVLVAHDEGLFRDQGLDV